jgi:hypothetical protein
MNNSVKKASRVLNPAPPGSEARLLSSYYESSYFGAEMSD